MVEIVLQRFGKISKKGERDILTTMNECYQRLKPHEVVLLDLILFNSQSLMKNFYSRERSALGVVSEDFSGSFFAIHDAWRGTSRIAICMDRMEKIPELVKIGALRHEVGHSVLHGSLEHYVFPITTPLLKAAEEHELSKDYLLNITYLISIAVKDFEVTKLLLEHGYFEDQVVYSKHNLSTSKDDLNAWELSKGNLAATVLCLAGRLKDAACYIALQPKLGKTHIKKMVIDELSYFPELIQNLMLEIIQSFSTSIKSNTFQNVDSTIRIFVEKVFNPLFNEQISNNSRQIK